MDSVLLSELFHVKGRFRRSVHLERDFYTENALDGYILTVTAREILARVVSTLENETAPKVWSLTGPYGSGKSAFALYTAKLLGNSNAPTTRQALELLKHGDAELYKRFTNGNGNGQFLSDFCPVLISGERAPLPIALLRGLEHGLKTFGILSSSSLRRKIRKLLKTTVEGTPPQATEITDLFESASRSIKKNGGQGLLLVIDELGKFLEYAAQDPAHGDVFVLQTLAEFATRSNDTPLFLVTILHQSFEQYANKVAKSQQEEWAKVQGRFEDIAFVEPTEQILRLIGSAIERTPKGEKEKLPLAIELNLKPNQITEGEFSELLRNCLPLHPTVVLVIDSIFRRFAQNERSLFAFLSASEPHGLQDFLLNQHYNGKTLPKLTIADLYDYLNTNMGNRLYASHKSKKWAEIESAIGRLPDPSTLSTNLIKTIGILNIVGEVIPNLKASERLLLYALDDDTKNFGTKYKTALTTLKKNSIAIYRRYNKAYALWEGSDVDIESRLREAETHVDTNPSLATELSRYMPTRPLVARRHLYQTGTLRYFAVRYTDFDSFDAALNEPLGNADGLVLYALPANEYEVTQFVKKISDIDIDDRKEVLIAVPHSIGFLRDSVAALACLRWVTDNTPELEGDAVAKGELSAQLVQAEREVSERLTAIFAGDRDYSCSWFHKGQLIDLIDSQGRRNAYLSAICDEVFYKTPVIRNELINRRKISGAATTARKNLIRHMLESSDRKNLGIIGYPPEMSVYRSLLWNTGIHRRESDVWGFHPPQIDGKNRIGHTWKEIENFFAECESERQPVEKLYERLKAPPYGVRSGILPILLCAAILHYKAEIALYEKGSFIVDWSLPVFERLLKAPQQFELKRFQITGIRADLFEEFLGMLNRSTEIKNPNLLTVVTPLIRFISQLPKYTLGTQFLSKNAKKLRKAVQNAREPDEFLFAQLPDAFGFSAFTPETATDLKTVSDFFNTLQDALSELEQTYGVLLNSIEQLLISAFNLDSSARELRSELAARAEPLLEVVIETQLKGFLIHLHSEGHDFTGWIESIGTFLAKKPPASWTDIDKAQFEINLSQLARKFRHFEAVSFEKLQHAEASGEIIRIGITTPNEHEQERVVSLTNGEHAEKVEQAIIKVFDDLDVDRNLEFRLAVLARLSKKLMQESEK